MQNINTKTRIEILAIIDNIKTLMHGNVTTEAIRDALEDCQLALDGHFINK